MTFSNWVCKTLIKRWQSSTPHRKQTGETVSLHLMRMEDRCVLSVSGGEMMLFSVGGTGANLPNVGQVEAADIVTYDGTRFELLFDGSDVGLSGANIDALAVAGENQFLLSFGSTTTIAGAGTFASSDVVLFTATSLGQDTAGTFSLFVSGSDLGLSGPAGNIDALDLLDDGSLVFSTAGNVFLPIGPNGQLAEVRDEDLVQVFPNANGSFAFGTQRMLLDGSQIGLGFDSEEIDAVSVDGSLFRFSTQGSFFIESIGLGGSREDVLSFEASAFGANTAGMFQGITFDGSQVVGFSFDLDALDFMAMPQPSNHPPIAENVSVTGEEDQLLSVQLLGDDGEADSDQALTYVIVDGPDNGTVVNFDPATGTFLYAPDADFFGSDHIVYLVQEMDDSGAVLSSESAVVNITITPVNDAPTLNVAQTQLRGPHGTPLVISGIRVQDLEADQDGSFVTVTLQVEHGVLSLANRLLNGEIQGNGTGVLKLIGSLAEINPLLNEGVTFQPDADFSGTTAVYVLAEDASAGVSMAASVQLEILAPPPPATVSFSDRIAELVASGELSQRQGQKLLNAFERGEQTGQFQIVLKKLDRWEHRGRLDFDLADELRQLIFEAADERSPNPGHPVDLAFAQFGRGKTGRHCGRFRC